MNNVSKKLQNFAYHPKDIRAEVSGIEQVARATVGSGSIVIRNNPEQDISGLNRNPDRAMTESSPKWSNMRAHWQDPFGDVANAASSLKKGFNYSQTFEHEGFRQRHERTMGRCKKRN